MNSLHWSKEPDNPQETLLSSQLESQLLALQAGAPLDASPHRPQPPEQEPTVRRVLLVAQGARAGAVAEAVVAVTRRWLPALQPLAVVAADGNHCNRNTQAGGEMLEDAVCAAVEQLASRELAAALRAEGFRLDRYAEFHIWLVADLEAEPAGDSSAPAAAVALLRSVERAVWRTLRLRALPHALLVASPQAGAQVARWATTLQQDHVTDVCLCGSVNLEHQSLRQAEWIEQTALALAGVCWGILPSHAQREQTGSICVLGAAAWASSLPSVQQWLALRTALAAMERLGENAVPETSRPLPAGDPSAADAAIDVMEWNAQLGARVPEPSGLKQWAGRQPSWGSLSDLDARLVAEEQQVEVRAAINERQARMIWLDRAVERWSAQFETERQAMLAPAAGLPTLSSWQASLEQTAQRLQRAQQTVDEALEGTGETLQDWQATEADAVQRLHTLTRAFPASGGWSSVWALLQFWRWPALLWAWFQWLPERCQALYAAQAQRRLAGWREANWHVLRQLLLSLQVRTRQAAQENVALRAALAQVAAALQARMDALEQTARLSPWTAETLQDLWQAAASGLVDERLAAYLRRQPLATWTNGDLDSQSGALSGALADVRAALLAANLSGPEPALLGWSALECLVNGLERSEVRRRDPVEHLLAHKPLRQPFAWLDDQYQQALPLWPKPSLRPDIARQNWLLLPASCITTARAGNRSVVAKLHWWLETLAEPIEAAACSGEALVFLRWVSVPIADLESEQGE